VHDIEGGTTYCPACHAALIERDGYRILRYALTDAGCCPRCATVIAGRFGKFEQGFGNRRMPVQLHAD
jgi:pyruvate formate lyase activating enzyme